MKIVVDLPSGPFWIALTSSRIQLSPMIIEVPLCWLVAPVTVPFLPALGVRIAKLGRVPSLAAVSSWLATCMSFFWGPYKHSAKVGQMAHLYGPFWALTAGF